MSRVTITRRHTGRYYVGLDEAAFVALGHMVRAAVAYKWDFDCMGAKQPKEIVEGGRRVLKSFQNFDSNSHANHNTK